MCDVPPFEIRDEIVLAGDEAQFEGCSSFLRSYLEQTDSILRRLAYTRSETWGFVLRAYYLGGSESEGTFICWMRDGSNEIQFAVDVVGSINDLKGV